MGIVRVEKYDPHGNLVESKARLENGHVVACVVDSPKVYRFGVSDEYRILAQLIGPVRMNDRLPLREGESAV